MKYLLIIVVIQSWFVPYVMADSGSEMSCNVPELVVYHEGYNSEVCLGVSMLEKGHFKEAIFHMEKALQINLYQVPNFYLIPRLALAYAFIGSEEKSGQLLEEAELALKIYTRILKCSEQDGKFSIVRYSGGKFYQINSLYHDRVVGIMCGAAYESLYYQKNLSVNIDEAMLVQHYLSIKAKLIEFMDQ